MVSEPYTLKCFLIAFKSSSHSFHFPLFPSESGDTNDLYDITFNLAACLVLFVFFLIYCFCCTLFGASLDSLFVPKVLAFLLL